MRSLISSMATIAVSALFLAKTGGVGLAQVTTPIRDSGYYHGPGMMWGGGSMGGIGMFFGFLFMLLLIAGIVLLVVLLLRSMNILGSTSTDSNQTQAKNAVLDILNERFAKGEIDAKEFNERKRLLSE